MVKIGKGIVILSTVMLASCAVQPGTPAATVEGVKYYREARDVFDAFLGQYAVEEARGGGVNFSGLALDLVGGVPRIRFTNANGSDVVEQFLLDTCHGDKVSKSTGLPFLTCSSGSPVTRMVSFYRREVNSSFQAANLALIKPLQIKHGYMVTVARFNGGALQTANISTKKLESDSK